MKVDFSKVKQGELVYQEREILDFVCEHPVFHDCIIALQKDGNPIVVNKMLISLHEEPKKDGYKHISIGVGESDMTFYVDGQKYVKAEAPKKDIEKIEVIHRPALAMDVKAITEAIIENGNKINELIDRVNELSRKA